jgi:hypothetical protein
LSQDAYGGDPGDRRLPYSGLPLQPSLGLFPEARKVLLQEAELILTGRSGGWLLSSTTDSIHRQKLPWALGCQKYDDTGRPLANGGLKDPSSRGLSTRVI